METTILSSIFYIKDTNLNKSDALFAILPSTGVWAIDVSQIMFRELYVYSSHTIVAPWKKKKESQGNGIAAPLLEIHTPNLKLLTFLWKISY